VRTAYDTSDGEKNTEKNADEKYMPFVRVCVYFFFLFFLFSWLRYFELFICTFLLPFVVNKAYQNVWRNGRRIGTHTIIILPRMRNGKARLHYFMRCRRPTTCSVVLMESKLKNSTTYVDGLQLQSESIVNKHYYVLSNSGLSNATVTFDYVYRLSLQDVKKRKTTKTEFAPV